ncbi:MAG TPA: pseudouridine-5'-phosphate glycosidase [Kofleriaceae bacterium]|nr:pseudouridine-5'-phosphate glycosidase [Kofleriaceae bacterium]
MTPAALEVAPEVAQALGRGGAVVALESTIIAHGLPYPDNLTVACELEATVRAAGAVPATIAVVEGRARVGLDEGLLARLAEDGARFRKAGAADLAVHLGRGSSAATTVSSTAFLAARAGIRVFATGGIGGVHRGDAGDVSSDLTTLASTPIAVVSAGAKAILDLPRTLEMLETLGVLVIGYQTDELPAFYTRSSGLRLEHRADDVAGLAAMVAMRWQLGQGGVLVANPIPAEAELPRAEVDGWIESGLAAANQGGITGKALTPFLLAHLARVSAGAAVTANRALALHDAAVAGALAVALSTWDH